MREGERERERGCSERNEVGRNGGYGVGYGEREGDGR